MMNFRKVARDEQDFTAKKPLEKLLIKVENLTVRINVKPKEEGNNKIFGIAYLPPTPITEEKGAAYEWNSKSLKLTAVRTPDAKEEQPAININVYAGMVENLKIRCNSCVTKLSSDGAEMEHLELYSRSGTKDAELYLWGSAPAKDVEIYADNEKVGSRMTFDKCDSYLIKKIKK